MGKTCPGKNIGLNCLKVGVNAERVLDFSLKGTMQKDSAFGL